MALQPDDLLIQRAALALAHLISEPDNDEMKDLDRQTIRRCAAAAAGEANFRQLVIDCAQTWTTVTEEGIFATRHSMLQGRLPLAGIAV